MNKPATQTESINQRLLGLTPYEPGKPEEELARELGITDIVKLASNENPRGPGPTVRDAIAAEVAQLSRYPDGHGYDLKQVLAQQIDCEPERITLGNGSNELLDLVARVTLDAGCEAIITEHGFVAYPLAIIAAGGTPVVVPAREYNQDLSATLAAITPKTRLIFIANPNNPTGTWHTHAELNAFLAKVPPKVWVVLDQAYYEYIGERDVADGMRLRHDYPNLIVTRSFSKAYGLAALRVGYGLSSPLMADLLNRVRLPFNTNRLAQVAATAALSDPDYVRESRMLNDAGQTQLAAGLSALGLDAIDSFANFITVDFSRPAVPIYEALLQRGVIVRPIGGYGLPNHLRITVGLEAENARLLDALRDIV